ncbi:MAG: type II toxin-antitoxin system HipA family toxin [Propionibacteriaceae bacterium]|nr:type II toxin-antitoxin system HipA family toxin [Propionibacteriaceae bacterium]
MSGRIYVAQGEADVGWLDVALSGGRASGSVFQYDAAYVATPGAFPVSPDLPLSARPIPLPGLPGAVRDAAPDAWGRQLIRRRLRGRAMTDLDALLGVSDDGRMGALRFRREPGGAFVQGGEPVPAVIALADLRRAADAVERGDEEAPVAVLLAAGSASLGGARPKALVRDGSRVFLAKFPSAADDHDVIRWEAVALELARLGGVDVPTARLVEVGSEAVLLLERFDRAAAARVPYWSAETAVAAADGDYLDLADAIRDGEAVGIKGQLGQLWRRVAFFVAVHNSDDHFRNHGFLRAGHGWTLAPAFDLNPDDVIGRARATTICGADLPAHEPAALVELAGELGLSRDAWQRALSDVLAAVDQWEAVAARHGLEAQEITRFRPILAGSTRARLAALTA